MVDPNADANRDDNRDPGGTPPPGVDVSVPHPARIRNFWLGGRDWFKADREAGETMGREFPHLPLLAREQRAFLVRAVRYLTGPARIRQFLDLGSGLPAGGNTHEIAQRIAADTAVVYVDNDPVVLAHANALLDSAPDVGVAIARMSSAGMTGSPGAAVMPAAVAAGMRARPGGASGVTAPVLRLGPVTYVDADLRDVGAVLRGASLTLDFSQPIAVMMLGVLGHVADRDAARSIVQQVMNALPSGSYLALADGVSTSDPVNRAHLRFTAQSDNGFGTVPYQLRQPDELASFVDGLELVPPGLVPCPAWKPDPVSGSRAARTAPDEAPAHCAVARKP